MHNVYNTHQLNKHSCLIQDIDQQFKKPVGT